MTERLKVLTWLWAQPSSRIRYEPAHVRVWAAMVRRHLQLEHTLAVVTDVPGDYGGLEIIPPPGDLEAVRIPTWGAERPQCFRRLAMFRRDAAEVFGCDRLVCMDLDVAISGSLDAVVDIPDDFRITAGSGGRRRYNGSMLSLRLGARPQVFEEFTPQRAAEAGWKHIGSDQSWLAHILPDETTWNADDGICFWHQHLNRNRPDIKAVFFAGGQKPWDLALAGDPFCASHYRGARDGRCLILGYAPSVWAEARAANGVFDMVIASPEAAEHRRSPGWLWRDVDVVANTDGQALALAAMHGFKPESIVFCGRQHERAAA